MAIPNDRKELPSLWQSFRQGFLQPSFFSLGVAILIASTLCYAAADSITEDWMLRHGAILSSGKGDVYAEVTQRALRQKHSVSNESRLLLAGHLPAAVPHPTRWPTRPSQEIVDLRTPEQSIYEAMTLIDQIPIHLSNRIIYAVTPSQLRQRENAVSEMERRSKIGVRSISGTVEMIRRGAPALPLRGNYFIDNQAYLLTRAPLAAGNLMEWLTGWSPPRTLPSATRGRNEAAIDSPMDLKNLQENLNSIGRLLEHCRFRGYAHCTVVFQTDVATAQSEVRWRLQSMVESKHAQFRVHLPSDEVWQGLPVEVLSEFGSFRP